MAKKGFREIVDFVNENVMANISDFVDVLFVNSGYASYDDWDNYPEYFCEDDKGITEYIIVSSFLGEMLREHGEPVYERDLGWVWGRETFGQSIACDEVIEQICREIGLIE